MKAHGRPHNVLRTTRLIVVPVLLDGSLIQQT